MNATSPALTLQHRNLDHCKSNPESFALRVIYEYDNAGLSFLRWNGGGDLFDEAVEAIEYIRLNRPDIVLWITSRKPEIASLISYHKNHFIHVSLDRTSLMKKEQIRSSFRHSNVFFSYQAHPDEDLDEAILKEIGLVFMHDYATIPEKYEADYKERFCPLNGAPSIKDMCGNCRRCFDGTFVKPNASVVA